MKIVHSSDFSRRKVGTRKGCGFINTLINKLPFEVHIPGYNYCGPGTKLEKRLARGDKGINQLDEACKAHDIAYSNTTNIEERHKADQQLAQTAFSRFKAKDASFGEKAAALGITGAMKTKVKLGMGRKRRIKTKKPKEVSFLTALKQARKLNNINPFKRVNKRTIPRVIPIPRKSGGFLPLLLAGLGAIGALASGGASIASTINKAKAAEKQLEENKRHNEKMESIALGKGLYLRPYKQGMGLYLKPYQSGRGLKRKSKN